MNKTELEKNRLDLSYKRNLQIINATLLLGVGSIITFIAALLLNRKSLTEYSIIISVLIILTYIFYKKTDKNLKQISEKIKKLIA